ncbi:hypothetical protein [Haloarcula halophila]|uniref:hypothetical protein n=1 Tax=Haloarcula TaxID=2237 RepID=UPI0023E46794|nr:hypothetical protein [Halomicroarcula sp. DFY41]
MSESEDDSGAGTREVAHRLFAAEFDDADFSYSESDEERAPNYVVTPTGARVNRLFVVGVLTEIEQVNEEVLRARIVDPTGAFVVYAGQYQPDELAFLEGATPPLFVAITGKARTFEPEDGDRVFTSVRPESISEVDADTRDRWVVQAAEQTLDRIGRMAGAKETGLAGDDLRQALLDRDVAEADAAGIALALDHYGTTGDYLEALRDLALDATRVVAGERDEAGTLSLSPDDGGDDPVPVLAATDHETPDSEARDGPDPTDASGTESAPAVGTDTEEAALDEGTEQPGTTAPDTGTEQPATTAESDAEPAAGTADEPDTDEQSERATGSADDAEQPASTTVDASDEGTEADDAPADEASETPIGADSIGETTTVESDESDDDIGEFEPEFDLDEDEREEIEDEFGTDFQSGSEVQEPGEADIETPDPEELADAAQQGAPAGAADAESAPESPGAPAGSESPAPDSDAATGDGQTETPETATDAGADETAGEVEATTEATDSSAEAVEEPADDIDLEDAVMEVMEELNDGGGADREAVLATVVDRYGADPDAVEDAIQDALMGGRCYEPDDGKLTPI